MSSEISRNKNWFFDILKACWGVLNFTRKAILNLIFIVLAVLIIGALSFEQKEKPIIFADNSVLELKLVGEIVEEKRFVDPYSEILNDAIGSSSDNPEILITDILNAIDAAAEDDKIVLLHLNLHGLFNSSMTHLQEIGIALKRFKETSGKPIIAYGDYYTQAQYYLAAHADEVVMNPMGSVILEGFGRYQMYYKDALESLKITSHVFRVGTFKSAVEPYLRNDMSDAAKEANEQWLGVLWDQYKSDVSALRNLSEDSFDESLDSLLSKFKAAGGDFSQYALNSKLIDAVMTHQEFDAFVQQKVEQKEPNYIALSDYLDYVDQTIQPIVKDKVAIVVASGTIYDGVRKPGEIGGHSTAELLKMAREDEAVKAVVLRVNSPGGSAFASEIIRNEVLALKQAGKPVIASMSGVAASGGYWISASADEIWASPTTITGSIGIFGMFMTYEKSLQHLGLSTDGVGTTELAGYGPTQALPAKLGDIIQLSIEQGYREFINLVSTERGMTPEAVDKIAQGRVWSGQTAKEIGLVDHLGYYDDAILAAAQRAELEDYEIIQITKPMKGFDKIIQELLGLAKVNLGYEPTPSTNQKVMSALKSVLKDTTRWIEFNDPRHMYVYCVQCDIAN